MTDATSKVVLITGGAMGMGKELARLFTRDAARIVLWDINGEELEKTTGDLKNDGARVRSYVVDVTDVDKVKEAADDIRRDLGLLDILVNNAGVVAGGNLLDVPLEKHLKTIDVNVNGVMICTHVFLPDMIEKGQGHIINMASAGGLMATAGLTAYCASKFAVVGFTEAIRMELRKMGLKLIRTTTVCPSIVSTGMFEGMKAPMMNPILTSKQMARKIYEGMKRNKVYVKEPFAVKTIPLMKAILPPDTYAALTESMNVHTAMETWTGRGNL